jgi:hypothetical protein
VHNELEISTDGNYLTAITGSLELEISTDGNYLTQLQAVWNFPQNAMRNNKRAHSKLSASNLAPLEYMTEDLQLESHYSANRFAFEHSFKLNKQDRRQPETHESLKCTVQHFAQCKTGHRLVY